MIRNWDRRDVEASLRHSQDTLKDLEAMSFGEFFVYYAWILKFSVLVRP
jgi:hypothetical protein